MARKRVNLANQLQLFQPRPVALLEWRNLCNEAPAIWEWMEEVGAYMPRSEGGYAMIDSRDLNPPRLHHTPWGVRWGK